MARHKRSIRDLGVLIATVLVTALVPLPAHACSSPRAPTKFPDGLTATEEQMLSAMHILKSYRVDVENFTKCLEFEASQNRMPREQQAIQHNTALENLRIVAEKFNEQVRIFKERPSLRSES